MTEEEPALTTGRDVAGLFVSLGIVFAVSAIGGALTVSAVGGWYQTLAKPTFTPPDWVFGPVWSAIYIMIAVAGWRAWRRAPLNSRTWAAALFAVQLALNLAWPMLFFSARLIGVAAVESVLLVVAVILTTIAFWRIETLAGALLVPYALWATFASVLNFAIWRLN